MSVKSPIEPPPDKGRISASGRISGGIFKNAVTGDKKLTNAEIAPEVRSIAVTDKIATSAGRIEMTVFKPSSTPSIKV